MALVGDRLPDRVCERRADRDDDLLRIGSLPRLAALEHDGLRVGFAAEQLGRIDDVRQRLEQTPPLAFEPVAGAGAAVDVRVVHGRMDKAVGVDHRGGLQVVGRDPLALHRHDRLRDVTEAAPVECKRDVEPGDTASEEVVGRLDSAARSRSGISVES